MDDGEEKTLEFVYSCDLDSQFKINLRSLDFLSLEKFFIRKFLEAPNNLFYQAFKPPFELFALVKLFSNDNPLCLSARSKSCFIGPGGVWNETISFPIKCNSLPRDACLAFTLYTMFTFGAYEPVGGATISLFKSSGKLREGRQCLELWEDQVADCSYPSLTPGLKKSSTLLSRLNKLLKQYEKGEMKRVYWLDVYTFKKIEKIKLFETKHRSLTRSSRQGHLGKDLKPNPSVRNILNVGLFLFFYPH
ncbi:hypothetical protein Zmor_008848 [Zophobas morio]|uniref:C2 PI3K-type domain-containing protein n=1 Tax=Zophobas morio TaxID=2755281 RepID=A0AA38HIJ8_9CUCU|nr:hypothetical protein Zmor_008848 [Zophobas morio]